MSGLVIRAGSNPAIPRTNILPGNKIFSRIKVSSNIPGMGPLIYSAFNNAGKINVPVNKGAKFIFDLEMKVGTNARHFITFDIGNASALLLSGDGKDIVKKILTRIKEECPGGTLISRIESPELFELLAAGGLYLREAKIEKFYDAPEYKEMFKVNPRAYKLYNKFLDLFFDGDYRKNLERVARIMRNVKKPMAQFGIKSVVTIFDVPKK